MEERKFKQDRLKDTEAKISVEMAHLHRQDTLMHGLATQSSQLRKEVKAGESKRVL